MKHPRATGRSEPVFTAALVIDSVGLGLLSAMFLFAWLSARNINLFVSLWLTANGFVLGGLVCLLALWLTRFAIGTASHR
ncbi:MAG TPA: hypothetical protein VIA82_08880 [Candidatus Limnocylindria bacterium]|jgi:hypothetical protein